MLVMSKDGNLIFTSNIRSNSVSVFDRNGKQGQQPTTIPVGKGPEAIDISPDGREVWVAHSQDGGVSIIDVASKKVIQTLSLGTKRSNRLKFTPDGKRVFISDLDAGEVVVLDAQTRKEFKRIKTGGHPEGILMAPDGRVFVAISDEGAIATIDPKTLEVTGKVQSGPDADGMAWAN
jgi:YVTN family beta-propeller protein